MSRKKTNNKRMKKHKKETRKKQTKENMNSFKWMCMQEKYPVPLSRQNNPVDCTKPRGNCVSSVTCGNIQKFRILATHCK